VKDIVRLRWSKATQPSSYDQIGLVLFDDHVCMTYEPFQWSYTGVTVRRAR